jgi:Type II secretory pathway, pullulanase PulA and related glycosidases
MNKDRKIGKSFPLGATVCPDGVNFGVSSKGGEAVQLLLFDHVDDAQPSRTITLDPDKNHSHHYWHVFVPGIEVGQIYGYRVERAALERELRFDPRKVLLDPYGPALRALRITAGWLRQSPAIIFATALNGRKPVRLGRR